LPGEIVRTDAGWTQVKPDDVLDLPAFGLRCKLSDLYRGTALQPHQPKG
jgi:hypothetical protein